MDTLDRNATEKRIGIIHRVIVPDEDFPKEYAVLLTDRRLIFIRQRKTRSSFVLRGEIRYGTALVTDVVPKTLQDYDSTSLESLANVPENLHFPHSSVRSLVLKKEVPKFRVRDVFVWLTMRRQGEIFQVYHFEMGYMKGPNHLGEIRFYMVPLGEYFKPRRMTQTRETILREYAEDARRLFQLVLPADSVS